MESYDFDPDFSEYNPIFAELESLKENLSKEEDEGFINNLIKKLNFQIIIQTD